MAVGRAKKNKKEQAKEAARVRRAPDEARRLILDAAERVFANQLPDVVGLKDVAREAGVSHALVTHYFGTYAALVEATLERRFERLRADIVPVMVDLVASEADTTAMLAAYRSAIQRAASDPATVRLLTWAMLSGRIGADDFFPHRQRGLELLADALAARSSAPREDLEFLLIVSFALAATWRVGERAFAGALGRKPTRELEEAFERRTESLIEGFLRAKEARENERERR
jgi:AcrR family transcriptional regulator